MKRLLLGSLVAFLIPLASFAAFTRDLRFGSRGADVSELQQFLKGEKIYSGPIIGYFGLLTKKAVQDFQKRENITPRSGFVGPLTRARLNLLAVGTTSPIVMPPTSTTTPVVDTTPPAFITGPSATLGTPNRDGPFGITAPYQIVFNWGTNEPAALVGFACDPNVLQSGLGAAATYWSGAAGRRSCTITVEDQAKNRAAREFFFTVPDLLVASGGRTIPFAENQYLGDITIRNNASTSLTLFQIKFSVTEDLNAPNSRGQKIDIFLREGTTTLATLLAHENITLRTTQPPAGSVNTHDLTLFAGKVFAPGEERTYGIWVESLRGPSFGGSIKFAVTSVVAIPDIAVSGSPVYTIQ